MTELSPVLRRGPERLRDDWDVIRVGRYYGLQALARLQAPGTVAIDPSATPSVYFFVRTGSTATWPLAPVIRVTTDFEMPPDERQTPPGIYWLLLPPRRGAVRLTDEGALFTARGHPRLGRGSIVTTSMSPQVRKVPPSAAELTEVEGRRRLDMKTEDVRAVEHWLLTTAARDPDVAREEWKTEGLTLLQCGVHFVAIRVPLYVAEAAAGSTVPAEVDAYLTQALPGAPIIRCQLGQRLYVLCEPSTVKKDWSTPGAEPLGKGHQLAVPRPDLVEHPGRALSYWAVPMPRPAVLENAAAVSQLVMHGRLRVAGAAHNPEHSPGQVETVDLGPACLAWDKIMKLTKELPREAPPRAAVEPVVAELQVYV